MAFWIAVEKVDVHACSAIFHTSISCLLSTEIYGGIISYVLKLKSSLKGILDTILYYSRYHIG